MYRHNDCCHHDHEHKKRSELCYRWLLSMSFMGLGFLLMMPFMMKQLLSRATSYATYERYDDAVRMYKRVLFFYKRDASVWDLLGSTYQESGNLDKAISSYRQAIRLDPENRSSRLNLGLIFMSQKKYREAVPCFEQIRSLGPDKKKKEKVEIISYYRSSLRALEVCYNTLNEIDKKNGVLEELRRYYP